MKGKCNKINKYELGFFSRCNYACFRKPILPEILKIIARKVDGAFSDTKIKLTQDLTYYNLLNVILIKGL